MITTQPVRISKLAAAVAFAGLVGLTAACAPEKAATEATSAAAESSVPVVGASPQPAPASVSEEPAEGVKACGDVKGPDGAMTLNILAGDIDCDTAKKIADEYVAAADGFLSGQNKEVSDGWICGPSVEVEGEMTRCIKGAEGFSLNR